MFIKKLKLTNFKRFTDLTLDLSTIQPPPKLVLMIGANGSGKSSIFDAFEWLYCRHLDHRLTGELPYYKKDSTQEVEVIAEFTDGQHFHRRENTFPIEIAQDHLFYGRSAFRQIPKLTRTSHNINVDLANDADRPRRYIERDERFENDIEEIPRKILDEFFSGNDFDSQTIREQYIIPINEAFARIFGDDPTTLLSFHKLLPARQRTVADIRFHKGESDIHYDLLSSGEKEVFNILLNLLSRKGTYQDTIYFIDELDVHLNTALQYKLIEEITEHWIPDGCQLWTASHSLGFIQYAREAEHAAILDLDQFDFDLPRTILPEQKESLDVYEIAVPKEMLSAIFQDKQLVFCENQDVKLYNLLGLEQKLFLPAKDKNTVYYSVNDNSTCFGLMDRDYMTLQEVEQIRQKLPRLYVLDYYSIESYLYHPDNISELVIAFDKESYIENLKMQKNTLQYGLSINLGQSRQGYKVLAELKVKLKKQQETVSNALASNDFDRYYPYLNMKDKIDRSFLKEYNLPKESLARTNWFKQAITSIFQ